MTRHAAAARTAPWPDEPGSIRLAELYTPALPSRVFPGLPALAGEARTWLLRQLEPFGSPPILVRSVDETISMNSYLYPDADYEGLFLATIFIVLQFVEDDLYDIGNIADSLQDVSLAGPVLADLETIKFKPDVLATVMGALYETVRDPLVPIEQRELPGGISGAMFLLPAFAEFATRLHAYGRRRNEQNFMSWLDCFCTSLASFSRAHKDKEYYAGGVAVGECIDRVAAMHGMEHQIQCLELVTGSFLSAEDRERPILKQMRNQCCAIGTYLNEIVSMEKEVVRDKADNLVPLLMARKGLTLRQSVQWVATRAQEHANEFERLSIQALAELAGHGEGEHALRHYVQGLRQMTAACWYWQIEGTTRYRSPTSPFAELLS